MSDKRLKIHQRLFSAIEGMIKNTKVLELNFTIKPQVRILNREVYCQSRLVEDIRIKDVRSKTTNFNVQIMDLVERFSNISVKYIPFTFLRKESKDLYVTNINQTKVYDTDLSTKIKVFDFFNRFQISGAFGYRTLINKLNCDLKIGLYRLLLKIQARMGDGLALSRKLFIKRPSVELTDIPEKKQLLFWKGLLLETKKHPKEFELIGIYENIPKDQIQNIKVDFNSRIIQFQVKTKGNEKPEYGEVALFNEIKYMKPILIELE